MQAIMCDRVLDKVFSIIIRESFKDLVLTSEKRLSKKIGDDAI